MLDARRTARGTGLCASRCCHTGSVIGAGARLGRRMRHHCGLRTPFVLGRRVQQRHSAPHSPPHAAAVAAGSAGVEQESMARAAGFARATHYPVGFNLMGVLVATKGR